MNPDLHGKKIAILVAHGFEECELQQPREQFIKAGAFTQIVSPEEAEVRGWDQGAFGNQFAVDVPLSKANADDYDALLLPGGLMNPDRLRTLPAAVEFTRDFFTDGKPVAAICHGVQLLVETGVLRGRTLTSFPSLKTDLENAGARWVDQEVVVDRGLVTSRRPSDLPSFNARFMEQIAGARARPVGA